DLDPVPPEGGGAPGVPGRQVRHRLHRPAPGGRQGRSAAAHRRRARGAARRLHDGRDRGVSARQGARRGGDRDEQRRRRRSLEDVRAPPADARRPAVKYEVSEKGGETRTIELKELGENLYEVKIDGETARVDAARSGRTIYSIIENGRQFEVVIDESGPRGFDVLVGGQLLHLEAMDERSRLLASTGKAAASGPQR